MSIDNMERGGALDGPTVRPISLPTPEARTIERSSSEIACACLKQYWPVFSYLGSLTGLGVGQYGLHSWIFTAGSAMAGLVTMVVGSYFLGKKDSVVDPQVVLRYQKLAADNMVKVEAAERRIQRILNLGKTLHEKLAAGESSISVNAMLAKLELQDLRTLNVEAEKLEEKLGAAFEDEKAIGLQMVDLNRRDAEDNLALGRISDVADASRFELDQFLATRLKSPI